MVNTVDDAIHSIESSYYPPLGKRCVGLARAQLYGEKFNQNLERLQKKKIKINLLLFKIWNIKDYMIWINLSW